MRVLEVRFLNLNSLAGEWRIDFRQPAYRQGGIFAITGPTGAGKSTILDAVCLALYGQTPRLKRITKSANELMTRNTGECRAEVAFATPSGNYRALFSQHRSRKHAQGELQAPRHELGELDSGRLLENSLKKTPEAVEAITGLDFERFTRSVLLAQGGFASFLNAEPAERAPILEELTGTSLYSRISIKAHEFKREAEDELKRLEDRGSALKLLSPEEERELRARLDDNEQKNARIAKRLEQSRQALNLADQAAEAGRTRKDLSREAIEMSRQAGALASERERLKIAEAAQSLEAMNSRLNEIRARRAANKNALDVLTGQRPQLVNERQQAEAEALRTRNDLNALKAIEDKELELFQTVRLLDDRLEAQLRRAEEEAGLLSQLENERALAGEVLEVIEKRLAESEKTYQELMAYQQQFTKDQHLAVNLPWWRKKVAELGQLEGQIQQLAADEIKQAELQVDLAAHLAAAEQSGRAIGQKLSGQEDELKALGQTLKEQLGPRTLKEMRAELEQLRRRETALAEACELERRLLDAAARQQELAGQQDLARRKLNQAERQLAALELESQNLAQVAAKRELAVRDFERFNKFAAERARLAEGEPCPLCGSLHHPGAKPGLEPAANPEESWLEAITRRDKAAAEETEHRLELAGLKKEAEFLNRELEAAAEAETRLRAELEAIRAGLFSLEDSGELEAAGLSRGLTIQRQKIATLGQLTGRLEELEETERRKRAALSELERAKAENDLVRERGRLELLKAREELERLQGESTKLRLRADIEKRELSEALAGYLPDFNNDWLGGLQKLTLRESAWAKAQTSLQEAASSKERLRLEAESQREQWRRLTAEAAARQSALTDCRKREAVLAEERRRLFGDRDPLAEERLLKQRLKRAEQLAEESQNNRWRAGDSLNRLDAESSLLAETEKRLAVELAQAQEEFNQALAGKGFAGFNDYEQALKPAEVLTAMRKKVADWDNKRAALKTRLLDNWRVLKNLKAWRLNPEDRAALAAEIAGLEHDLQRLAEENGALSQRLKDNQAALAEEGRRAAEITRQKKSLARWRRLHDLIGSADGKKYRNFAQSLTFDQMIRQANLKLAKLTDRYKLIREEGSSLGLAVIDQYQFGEIRSTRNLSGGESFLISLALALGLSQMASRKVRVDSLFLDEGFGALDEEALDSALSVLAALPQDGKLIGLISHIPAVRERVTVQIQVRPLTGGRSRLEGPGCSGGAVQDSDY